MKGKQTRSNHCNITLIFTTFENLEDYWRATMDFNSTNFYANIVDNDTVININFYHKNIKIQHIIEMIEANR